MLIGVLELDVDRAVWPPSTFADHMGAGNNATVGAQQAPTDGQAFWLSADAYLPGRGFVAYGGLAHLISLSRCPSRTRTA